MKIPKKSLKPWNHHQKKILLTFSTKNKTPEMHQLRCLKIHTWSCARGAHTGHFASVVGHFGRFPCEVPSYWRFSTIPLADSNINLRQKVCWIRLTLKRKTGIWRIPLRGSWRMHIPKKKRGKFGKSATQKWFFGGKGYVNKKCPVSGIWIEIYKWSISYRLPYENWLDSWGSEIIPKKNLQIIRVIGIGIVE